MGSGKSTRYEWTIVVLLALMWGFVGLNRVGIAYIFPKIVPLFHMQPWQVGLLLSGTSITWAVTAWWGGYLSDRYGRRRVLLPAIGIAAVITGLMGAAWNFISMFVVRDLLGLGDGVGWSTGQAILAEESTPSRRGFNQGLMSATYSLIGAGVGAFLVTRLTVAFGWRAVFPIIGFVTLIIVAMLYRWMRKSGPERAEGSTAVGNASRSVAFGEMVQRMFSDRYMIVLMVLNVCILTWLQVTIGFNTLFLTKVHHFSLIQAGDTGSIWGLVGFCGTVILPVLSDVLGRKVVLASSALISGVLLLVYTYGGLTAGGMTLVLAVEGFFGWGLLPIGMATCVSEVVSDELHGAAIGVTNFFGVLIGTSVMPIIAGILAGTSGLSVTLLISSIGELLVIPLTLMLRETAPRVVARRRAAANS